MSIDRVDYLFRGSHPAFFWAAALLASKGLKVVVLAEPDAHGWDRFPLEVLPLLGIESLKCNRDEQPIQLLTSTARMSVFSHLDLTVRDHSFCTGDLPSPEIDRGLAFYSKGSDLPSVFGETSSELLHAVHRIEYLDVPKKIVFEKAKSELERKGVLFLNDDHDLPIAEQTVILDFNRAKVFRTRFTFSIPLKALPVGATTRMVYIEKNSPLIEMLFLEKHLHLSTQLPEDPGLINRMLKAIEPYFPGISSQAHKVRRHELQVEDQEWVEHLSNVETSRLGQWILSPAINPELGERSLYLRISELLSKKTKKTQLFVNQELFS